MEKEKWKDYDVPNYGTIKVSSYGRVIGKTGKMLSEKYDSCGYVYYRFHHPDYRLKLARGERYMEQIRAHRLVGFCFLENPDNKTEINHIDRKRTNNFYKNLEWVTHIENIQHSKDLGSYEDIFVGEKNPRSKLQDADVPKIRSMYKNNVPIAEIARNFGVGWTTISHLLKGETWNHV